MLTQCTGNGLCVSMVLDAWYLMPYPMRNLPKDEAIACILLSTDLVLFCSVFFMFQSASRKSILSRVLFKEKGLGLGIHKQYTIKYLLSAGYLATAFMFSSHAGLCHI